MKLLMLRGLPASGKTTFAKELEKNGWARMSKDDIRALYPSIKESEVIEIENRETIEALEDGKDVVIDDCNLNPFHKERFLKMAEQFDAVVEIKDFTTPLDECIKRDSLREKSVGEKVIMDMHMKYLEPKKPELIVVDPALPNVYLFDIDGTLALNKSGRGFYDWKRVGEDSPNRDVINVLLKLRTTCKILVMSGRDSICENETFDWLTKNGIPFNGLIMREHGDNRKDNIIKQELFDKHIRGKYNVLGVFDDRDSVVKMWRDMGLTCFQVNYGNF